MTSRQVLDSDGLERALTRIAHEILESNAGPSDLVLVGVVARGPVLARRIAAVIERVEGVSVPVGEIDVTFHRDDVRLRRLQATATSSLPVAVDSKSVVIVDDVLYTGRTVRAAMDELLDFGRPARIQLAALVDRGHRELPIRADFIGKNIPTAPGERVVVRLREVDERDEVLLTFSDPVNGEAT
ncbi:MAG: bifunctional pyr operon transcriptional regulator/uracil phosphoribosyltransferase PyrR [Acidobacteria bacterium]|nr:MAG: bifunctional pyr operon transcriptional regulator/uracil phosphoribosyltransferase PyrR [Acidobacteriota bacterium]